MSSTYCKWNILSVHELTNKVLPTFSRYLIYTRTHHPSAPLTSGNITSYPSPPTLPISTYFTLTANSLKIPVLVAATYHTASFSAPVGQAISLTLTYSGGDIKNFTVLPTGSGLLESGTPHKNTLNFGLSSPYNVEVRINDAVSTIGDVPSTTVMYLSLDLPEVKEEIPNPGDGDVLYFGAGVHNVGYLEFNETKVAPKQIYVVRSCFEFSGV